MPAPAKISVCIATYNRVRRLQNLIKLLFESTLTDFELIISDDCSNDGTEEAVRAISDPRIRFFRQPRNLGIHMNWEFAARQATAPIIFRIDDDDYMAPGFLMKVVDFFERHPEAGSVYTGYAYTRVYDFTNSVQVVDQGVFAGRQVVSSDDFLRAFLLHDPFPGAHFAAVSYRRETAEKIWFYRPDKPDFRTILSALRWRRRRRLDTSPRFCSITFSMMRRGSPMRGLVRISITIRSISPGPSMKPALNVSTEMHFSKASARRCTAAT